MGETIDQLPFVLGNSRHGIVYRPRVRPTLELKNSIAFVLNVERLVGMPSNGSIPIAPDHELRRANAEEILAIKEVLRGFYGEEENWWRWECRRLLGDKGEWSFEKLPVDQWRYFVISFPAYPDATVCAIERALSLATPDVRLGFSVIKAQYKELTMPALSFEPARLFQQIQRVRTGSLRFVDVNESDVGGFVTLCTQISNFKHDCVDMDSLIGQVIDLEALPERSPLVFLGYFALLESILTHQPKKSDTIDSITRQIIRKTALLDNRWQPRLDYSDFNGARPETVWSAMYNYRSCLAHGGRPDFAKDLKVLSDRWNALRLLKDTLKATVRQVLAEPQLVVDLRNC